MNEDYEIALDRLKAVYRDKEIDELDYELIFEMFMDSDGEDCGRLIMILNKFIEALADHKKQKINDRLIIGAQKIEDTTDPKERARLMVHYNNLLKELGA